MGSEKAERPVVRREALGEAVRALLPIEKLKRQSPRGAPFERELHEFLLTNFSGYTVSSGAISGHWANDLGHDEYGEHREYCVAMPSREGLRTLEIFLATLAHDLGEECILVQIGSEMVLVYRTDGA
jgi:hypothetical protein